MVDSLDGRVQRERSFAIVDEVDNILIDEARTPLIISGQAEESADLYFSFARLVPKLQPRPEGAEEGGDYFVDLKDKAVSPTEEGVDKIEKLLGIENLYDADPRLARHFDSALKAHALYKRDRDYIVEDGEIVIVDEFTGRKMPGRRWSEGLHQAVEAKEGPARPAREPDAGDDHVPELLPPVRQARRHDRHGDDRGRGVPQDLHPRGGGDPDPPPDDPRRLPGPRLQERDVQVQRADRRDRGDDDGRPARAGRHGVGREVRGPLDAAQAARDQARDAERQVPRAEAGIVAQAGRPAPSRSRPTWRAAAPTSSSVATRAAWRRRSSTSAGSTRPRWTPDDGRGARGGEGGRRRGPRGGRGRRRPAHHRHRAPREPAHRQPAARPCRAPGRPGLVALLPLARRRPDEALRLGPGRRADGADGPRGRRRRSSRSSSRGRSRAPRRASRASTSTSASASSSSTTSSTSSARRSTPSATRSCATRT